MNRPLSFAFAALLLCSFASAQQPDAETRRWWDNVRVMSADNMEGRDTGSKGYERAAEWVAKQFAAAGAKPAGENGTYFQKVPMVQTTLEAKKSSAALTNGDLSAPLAFLYDINVTVPGEGGAAKIDVPLVFLGYGLSADEYQRFDLKGKGVVVYGGFPKSLDPEKYSQAAAQRAKLLNAAGAKAVITLADPNSLEPFRWPFAYARRVALEGSRPPQSNYTAFLLNNKHAPQILEGSGIDWNDLVKKAAAGEPLPVAELKWRFNAEVSFAGGQSISSPNVLAVVPGSDPKLANEYVVLSAHLDGYGYGEPIDGDNLYNGAYDDAAYVSTLIEFARLVKEGKYKSRRSVLLAAFTGEEKGLLGSAYFTQHPTVAKESLVANMNLDQLRPLFPLKIVTVEGLEHSSLGDTVRQVAGKMHVEVRPDLEPQRQLFFRADNVNFFRIGVPALGFVFGYDHGSDAEKKYREWYDKRYHRPSDDINQPIDYQAAADMNDLIYGVTTSIANADARPTWSDSSPYKPKK